VSVLDDGGNYENLMLRCGVQVDDIRLNVPRIMVGQSVRALAPLPLAAHHSLLAAHHA
jgi:hypothetical protein